MTIKICIWMNMPSHHQSAFFREIQNLNDINLEVRYYSKIPKVRKELGWNEKELLTYEKYIESTNELDTLLPDWEKRIHIVPGFSNAFLNKLINFFITNNTKWIHWSERAGVNLAKILNFNYGLYNLVYPLFLYIKGYRKYAKQINNYALGAFAIGELAKDDFLKWGIKKEIFFLPYSIEPLLKCDTSEKNEIVFMYIGELSKRKGIDTLINAYSLVLKETTIKTKLILIGKDRSNNEYVNQSRKLGILKYIEFLGMIKSDLMNQYLSKSDVFILPSNFDGWGAVLNEAASLSKPLISTDKVGASNHLIKDNGFIIKNNNEIELKKAMIYYVNFPHKIEEHGKKSYELFNQINPKKSAQTFLTNIKYLSELSK